MEWVHPGPRPQRRLRYATFRVDTEGEANVFMRWDFLVTSLKRGGSIERFVFWSDIAPERLVRESLDALVIGILNFDAGTVNPSMCWDELLDSTFVTPAGVGVDVGAPSLVSCIVESPEEGCCASDASVLGYISEDGSRGWAGRPKACCEIVCCRMLVTAKGAR